MPRLTAVDPDTASGKQKEVLDAAKAKMGKVPNIIRGLANSPAAAEAYFALSGALQHASLDAKMRERIALVVGEQSGCHYCLAAHTMIGKGAGLDQDEMLAARRGESDDPKTAALLSFVRRFVEKRGWATDEEVQALRDAGFTDGELAEVVAVVALNLFTNYFNHLNDTEVDFPPAVPLA